MTRKHRPFHRSVAGFIPLTFVAAMLLFVPVADQAVDFNQDAPEEVPFADGGDIETTEPESDPSQVEAEEATGVLAAPVWPSTAVVDTAVDATLTAAGDTLVSVRSITGTDAPESVQVRIHDQSASADANVTGVLVDIEATEGSGSVMVELDYSAFAHAYGADWATRLRLWQRTSSSVELMDSTNNRADQTVTATVSLADDTVGLALMADVSGPTGDFSATELSPSATWSHGGNSGGFNWSYPVGVPNPVGAGPVPDVSLDYSSASVDGRTEASNNQPGWIGEGWGLTVGSIERRYGSCAADMGDGASNTTKTGDKCWVVDGSVMLTMAGRGGEVIRDDDTGQWRLKNDDGTKFEKLTDTVNADNSNEYWRVTTPDGMKYYFGLNRLPGWASGDPETKSTWTVPVSGNHPGEPCYSATFKNSFCDQAWKWNLDYVEDPYGNTMSYWYTPQSNKYSQAGDASNTVSYIRGGELTRIDYGTDNRDGTEFSGKAPARVLFTSGDRCLSNCSDHNEANWPDTPWDTECTGSSCVGKTSPSFWSSKRLTKITTQVWDAANNKHQDIDSWSLTHTFPNPGDGSRAGLWLDSITRTGHVGGTEATPKVDFDWVQMHNRVEVWDGIPTMNWMRIANIWTESGGRLALEYSPQDCTDGDLPSSPGNNTRLCYPVLVPQQADPDKLETHWYHKYVLTTVVEYDLLTEADTRVTEYEYVGDPAWRFAAPDELVEKKYRTWSDWRGFSTVLTRVGKGDSQTLTESNYFRGMHGDKNPAGGTRSVTVPGSVGDPITDDNLFAGMIRETTIYNGIASDPVSRQVFEPWKSSATATRTSSAGDTSHARYIRGEGTAYQQTMLDAGRGWRTTKTENTFDSYGMISRTADHGDVAVSGDEQCSYTEYARNTAKNILDTVKRTYSHAIACGQQPQSDKDILADTRHHYDDLAYGTAPTTGTVTLTETINEFTDANPGYVMQSRTEHDAAGRITSAWDIRGNQTSTTFTPSSGVITATMTTNPMGWTESTDLDLRGNTLRKTDYNGKVTTMAYDPLGRLSKVWLPNLWNVDPNMPSYEFDYQLSRTGENSVTTKVLNAASTGSTPYYTVSTAILDGMLRVRQNQTVSPGDGGGRILTDALYDNNGRSAGTRGPYRTTGEPTTTLFVPTAGSVPNLTETVYDRADRVIASIQYDLHEELWRTVTRYAGDHTTVIPPDGGTPTTTVTDARGRTVELRQHLSPDATGAYQSTVYDYTKAGQLKSVTDPEGNSWEYGYDLLGRQVSTDDPDKGPSTTDYNDYGDVTSSTDARGETLAYEYDQIGRKIGLYEDDLTGTKLSEWRYDRLLDRDALGQFAGWSRWVDGNEYRFDIRTYNELYQPGGVQHVIPASEGPLAGSYISSTGYALDGSLKSFQYARSTALTNENVVYKFDPRSGLPVRLDEGFRQYGYVTGASYTGLGELESVRYSHNSYYSQQTNFYDDVTRRLTKSTVYAERADALLSDTRYSYDDMGNILSIGEQIRGDYQCFGYDNLRRLTQAWTPGDGDCGAAPDTAALGGPAPYWTSYEHDAIGNRVTMIDHANPLGPSTTSYSTPAAGQAQPHAVVGTTTTVGETTAEAVFEYDAAGNMITRPGQALTWDAEGRLDTLTTDDGDVTSHVYTPDGDRLMRKNSDGSATLYLPGQEISVTAQGSLSCTRYYSFAGSTFGVRTGSTSTGTQLSWLFNDHQGTASMSQFAGGDTAVFRYRDPFGNERGGPVTWPGERGFVGGTDDPSGLTHLGAREYDPGLGVFISVDPVMDLANPKQMHAYTYANGNPTTFADPTGLYTPERNGVPCIDGDCSFHNKDGSLKNKNQCAKTGCGTNPLYTPGSKPRPGTSGANGPTGDPTKCIDGDCSFHNKDGSLKTEDQCARTHCGTNSNYTRNPWISPLITASCHPANPAGCLDYFDDPNKAFSFNLGMAAMGLALLTGGNCGVVHDLLACETGWLEFYFRGGTQYGDTFISDKSLTELTKKPGLTAHEKHHRDAQWQKYGIAFIGLYFGAMFVEEWILGKPCNIWERDAERASNGGGGYSC